MRAVESIEFIAKPGHSPIELVKLLKDRDELVRVATVSALGTIRDVKTLPQLRRSINDKSALVRRYACVSIAKFGLSDDSSRLKRGLKKERLDTAKLGYYHGLYLLGEKGLVYKLLALLTSEDYRIRCATAHALGEIPINKFQKQLIVEALRERCHVEQTVAARSSFRAVLRQLKK